MTQYELGTFNLGLICRLHGSTILKALLFAAPSACLASLMVRLRIEDPELLVRTLGISEHLQETQWWLSLNVILGLALSFRTMQALGRFWQANSLVHQMRMEWFNAASNLVSFTKASDLDADVRDFLFVLVRLVSLLHGLALNQLQKGSHDKFLILGLDGLDEQSLVYLKYCKDNKINRVELVMHWIQELVSEHLGTGVIPVAAPIVAQVYQQLARGLVIHHDAKNIADVPFPYPHAQFILVLLLLNVVLAPIAISSLVTSSFWAAVVTIVTVLPVWAINLVAGQIEQPFCDDYNDIPLASMQEKMNSSLFMLLDVNARRTPSLRSGAAKKRSLVARGSQVGNSRTRTLDNLVDLSMAGQNGSSGRMSTLSSLDDGLLAEAYGVEVCSVLSTSSASEAMSQEDEQVPDGELESCPARANSAICQSLDCCRAVSSGHHQLEDELTPCSFQCSSSHFMDKAALQPSDTSPGPPEVIPAAVQSLSLIPSLPGPPSKRPSTRQVELQSSTDRERAFSFAESRSGNTRDGTSESSRQSQEREVESNDAADASLGEAPRRPPALNFGEGLRWELEQRDVARNSLEREEPQSFWRSCQDEGLEGEFPMPLSLASMCVDFSPPPGAFDCAMTPALGPASAAAVSTCEYVASQPMGSFGTAHVGQSTRPDTDQILMF